MVSGISFERRLDQKSGQEKTVILETCFLTDPPYIEIFPLENPNKTASVKIPLWRSSVLNVTDGQDVRVGDVLALCKNR